MCAPEFDSLTVHCRSSNLIKMQACAMQACQGASAGGSSVHLNTWHMPLPTFGQTRTDSSRMVMAHSRAPMMQQVHVHSLRAGSQVRNALHGEGSLANHRSSHGSVHGRVVQSHAHSQGWKPSTLPSGCSTAGTCRAGPLHAHASTSIEGSSSSSSSDRSSGTSSTNSSNGTSSTSSTAGSAAPTSLGSSISSQGAIKMQGSAAAASGNSKGASASTSKGSSSNSSGGTGSSSSCSGSSSPDTDLIISSGKRPRTSKAGAKPKVQTQQSSASISTKKAISNAKSKLAGDGSNRGDSNEPTASRVPGATPKTSPRAKPAAKSKAPASRASKVTKEAVPKSGLKRRGGSSSSTLGSSSSSRTAGGVSYDDSLVPEYTGVTTPRAASARDVSTRDASAMVAWNKAADLSHAGVMDDAVGRGAVVSSRGSLQAPLLPAPLSMPPGTLKSAGSQRLDSALCSELEAFMHANIPTEANVQAMNKVLAGLTRAVAATWPGREGVALHLFGSAANGMCSRHSDLDVVVVGVAAPREGADYYQHDERGQVSQELGRLAEKLPLCMELRPKAVIDIRAGNKRKTMLITTGARMPVLKAVSGSGVAFDVSLTTMAGPQIAAYMRQQAESHPCLRPLLLLLKALLRAQAGLQLAEPAAGGMGSHGLALMVVGHILHEERKGVSPLDAGRMLRTFLARYGKGYKFGERVVSVAHGGDLPRTEPALAAMRARASFRWKKDRYTVIDPLTGRNVTEGVDKSEEVKRTFKLAAAFLVEAAAAAGPAGTLDSDSTPMQASTTILQQLLSEPLLPAVDAASLDIQTMMRGGRGGRRR